MTSDPTPTDAQLAELVALAGKATPGSLILRRYIYGAGRLSDETDRHLVADVYVGDARFVAAANPAVIGPLASEALQLRKRVEELTEALAGLSASAWHYRDCPRSLGDRPGCNCGLWNARDVARAALPEIPS